MKLSVDERDELRAVLRQRHGNAAVIRRARCVLLWADGERRMRSSSTAPTRDADARESVRPRFGARNAGTHAASREDLLTPPGTCPNFDQIRQEIRVRPDLKFFTSRHERRFQKTHHHDAGIRAMNETLTPPKLDKKPSSRPSSIGRLATLFALTMSIAWAALQPLPARAADGCLVLLCLAAPSWQNIGQCIDPVRSVLNDLLHGRPFPTCDMSGSDNRATNQWSNAPSYCPPQYTHSFDLQSGTVYGCDYDGAVEVDVAGVLWTRTWWRSGGDSVTRRILSSIKGASDRYRDLICATVEATSIPPLDHNQRSWSSCFHVTP